jgi:16S rRNA (cytidine1402-2'-O)-methyltransferase
MSEAGCPGIADPGAELVKHAHRNGIKVIPLVGPSSILLALMGSGFNGQNFAFVGYLPKESGARKQRMRELEKHAKNQRQTQLFIETPYRNVQLFEELLSSLQQDTLLNISCNITMPDQLILSQSIEQWKKSPVPDIHKKPCMFGIYW